jgi:hypothetical protein
MVAQLPASNFRPGAASSAEVLAPQSTEQKAADLRGCLMKQLSKHILIGVWIFLAFGTMTDVCTVASSRQAISRQVERQTIQSLVEIHGESHSSRIKTCVKRVSSLWWTEDGNEADFRAFCSNHFIADAEEVIEATRRVDKGLESLRGHLHRINREIRLPFIRTDLKPTALDSLLERSIPGIDYFRSKLAFFIALNFSRYSLDQMLAEGPEWSEHQWAAARIGEMFAERIPPDAAEEAARYGKGKGAYFHNYFIHMDRVLTPEKKIIFPDGLKLNCHHGLRDNLKGQYSKAEGLSRQQMIYTIMLRIITTSWKARISQRSWNECVRLDA